MVALIEFSALQMTSIGLGVNARPSANRGIQWIGWSTYFKTIRTGMHTIMTVIKTDYRPMEDGIGGMLPTIFTVICLLLVILELSLEPTKDNN